MFIGTGRIWYNKDRLTLPVAGDFDVLNRVLDSFLPSRRRAEDLERDLRQFSAFAASIPYEYCGWSEGGAMAVSPGFAAMLGVDRLRGFEDVQRALTPADGAALLKLHERLLKTGHAFEAIVYAPAVSRHLRLSGKRGHLPAAAGDDPAPAAIFHTLWLSDVTDIVQAAQEGVAAAASSAVRENVMRAALDALDFPVWMRDKDLNISWTNRFYQSVVDDTAAAVISEQKELPLTGAAKNEMTPRVLAQRAFAKGYPQSMRGHIIVQNQRKLVDIAEIPLVDEKRMIGLALDITKEEEWSSAYERLSASYKESMEQLRTSIAMFDADTRLEFYNAAYEQLTGMPAQFLDQRPKFVEIVDKLRELRKLPELVDYKLYKQQWQHKFTSLIEPHEEMQYLPDGSVLRMIVVPRPMGGLIITQEDVTSRLQLETSYNTLIAVQQETMDNLSEGLAVFGEDGRLRLSNQSFAAMWKIAPEKLSGAAHVSQIIEQARAFFAEGEWAAVKNILLANALERDTRRGRLELNDGRVLEYSVVPLPDGNMLNAYFDITDTVRVEEALREKNAALEAAERLKTDFLANVSYQLRTPLNAILGFAEMLHQQYVGPLNERQVEYTGSMIEAGQRLVSLINDILDLSTIDAGYMKIYPVSMDVSGLLHHVAALTTDWARKQKLEITVDAPDALMIEADEKRIKQVMLNLISNAINYSPQGGRITISARMVEGDFITINVADTGMGIPAADIKRIFTPFEKINDGRIRRRSGAGLGLALVKNIMQLHGGDVGIDSIEGKGTTVTCRLPIRIGN